MATKNYENGIISIDDSGDVVISQDIMITGDVFYVDSVNGNDANSGTNRTEPKATLASAISSATTTSCDLIIVEAGHTETLTSSITLNKSNMRIYGLGTGTSKPTFTVNANVDLFDFTFSGIEINNLRFPIGTAANTAKVNIDSPLGKVINCDFFCGTNDAAQITLTTNATLPEISGCTFTVSQVNSTIGVHIQGAITTEVKVIGCTFDGGDYNFDTGAIYSASANLFFFKDNTLLNKASIITSGTSKGICTGTIAGDGSKVVI